MSARLIVLFAMMWVLGAACSPGSGGVDAPPSGSAGTSSGGSGAGHGQGTGAEGPILVPTLDGGTSSNCTPLTCEDVGANCGPIGDGCNGVVECGECTAPETCGGGGEPSRCGYEMPECTPLTCEGQGANCGRVTDGCGGLTPECGTCTPPAICGGGGVASQCGGGDDTSDVCDGLCLHQVDCEGGGATTLTGVVYTPSGEVPIYNALVYVPNAAVPAISDGVSCDRCEGEYLGRPLVSALTAADGSFELRNVPAGVSFPLVVKIGKWRRVVEISAVDACTMRALTAEQTRLPRNASEGHIPRIAISTGRVDALECVLYKAGIDASEFTRPTGDGRIHLYRANGAWPDADARTCDGCNCGWCGLSCCGPSSSCGFLCSGGGCCNSACATCGGGSNKDSYLAPLQAQRLYESQEVLDGYDVVAFGCEASERSRGAAHRSRLREYVDKGGRLFLSHFNYDWIRTGSSETDPLHTTAVWGGGSGRGALSDPTPALVDGTFPKGAAFIEWLDAVNASHPVHGTGVISIDEPRRYVEDTPERGRRWIHTTEPLHGEDSIQHFTFNTPVGLSEEAMCGRVVYTAFHVATGEHGDSVFPNHCTGPLAPQEKVLLFMLFDLATCVSDDTREPRPPPTCTPRTCEESDAHCGLIGDGCGGIVDCGLCPPGQACGVGGPNQCGDPPAGCQPKTCQEQNAGCGQVADGCGGLLECGTCPEGETCGGGGVPYQCGRPRIN
jgi:hypothetical protein